MKQDEQIQEIPLSEISLDRETQIREAISEETVQRYYDMMESETGRGKFPPILLILDEVGKYWIADGHHRVTAAIRREFTSIRAIVRIGTKADAIWKAAESNAKNGLPIFGTDYRRAVTVLAEAYPDRSNVMIADVLRCSEKTVRKYRLPQSGSDLSEPVKRTGKDGKSYPARKIKKTLPVADAVEPSEEVEIDIDIDIDQELADLVEVPVETLKKVEYILAHADEESKSSLRDNGGRGEIDHVYEKLKASEICEKDNCNIIEAVSDQPPFRPGSFPTKKYVGETQLKPIPRDRPDILVANLIAFFPKEFVPNAARAIFKMLYNRYGDEVIGPLLDELNEKYRPKNDAP